MDCRATENATGHQVPFCRIKTLQRDSVSVAKLGRVLGEKKPGAAPRPQPRIAPGQKQSRKLYRAKAAVAN